MNLRSLRTFVATADSGGLGRASARLHLSQPAASGQIGALEAEFGLPLFQRVCHRLLGPVHLLAVLPKNHRLGRRAVIEITELAEEPLLLMQREYAGRQWLDAACQAAHVVPRVLMECTTAYSLIELAAVGYGIAV